MAEFDPKSVVPIGTLGSETAGCVDGRRIDERAAVLALDAVADGVLVADASGQLTFSNPVARQLFDKASAQEGGTDVNVLLPLTSRDGDLLPPLLPPTANSELPASWEVSGFLPALDGGERREISVVVTLLREGAQVSGYVLVLRETSAARRISSRLSWQSAHDSLTGLANRQSFESELQQLLLHCAERNDHHVLLYVDVYQFKVINDTLGYAAGDQLLVELVQTLAVQLAEGDLFARVGSDEFAILLRDCTIEEARRVVLRLREAVLGFSFQWQDDDRRVAVSIGAVTVDRHAASSSQLMAAANDACCAARDEGRNRVKLFNDSRRIVEKRRQTTWVAEIHAALREDRMLLYRQPVVGLGEQAPAVASAPTEADYHVHHYEVLVRMRGRDGDVISPGLFLPAAERYGLIEDIDRWVIRHVFAYMAQEQALGLTNRYAINISGLSLGDDTFGDYVLGELVEAGVAPSLVQFEITETTAIENLERALIFIHKLRAAGCSFALDDFGRGVSSLAYLRQLPVEYLKIDGSFVRNMLNDEIDSAMVSTIDHLAKRMGISTIAEYVETPELMQKLAVMGVDYAQGYGIAAASSFPELAEPSREAPR